MSSREKSLQLDIEPPTTPFGYNINSPLIDLQVVIVNRVYYIIIVHLPSDVDCLFFGGGHKLKIQLQKEPKTQQLGRNNALHEGINK